MFTFNDCNGSRVRMWFLFVCLQHGAENGSIGGGVQLLGEPRPDTPFFIATEFKVTFRLIKLL